SPDEQRPLTRTPPTRHHMTPKRLGSMLRKLFGRNFDEDVQVKMIVASSFWKDSLSHWQRFRILRHTRLDLLPQRPFRSKLFVDLLFCAECALKSLVVSLSPMSETPEEAFKK